MTSMKEESSVVTIVQGIPPKIMAGKKIVLEGYSIVIVDIETSKCWEIDAFLKEHKQVIRNAKIEIIFS
jgi:hypothetical protein